MSTRKEYNDVQALLLSWEDRQDLERVIELQTRDLKDTLTDYYHYNVQEFLIPSQDAEIALDEVLSKFLREYNKVGNLLIVYYNGHGDIDAKSKEPLWMCYNVEGSPFVQWSFLQHKFLNNKKADTLFLLDCCHAGSAIRSVSNFEPFQHFKGSHSKVPPIVEVIAASGFETDTPLHGKNTFSHNLILELKNAINERKEPGAFAYYIYNELLNSLKQFAFSDEGQSSSALRFSLDPNPYFDRNTVWLGVYSKPSTPAATQEPPITYQRVTMALEKGPNDRMIGLLARLEKSPSAKNSRERDAEVEMEPLGARGERTAAAWSADAWFDMWNIFEIKSRYYENHLHKSVSNGRRPKAALFCSGISSDYFTAEMIELLTIRDARNFTPGGGNEDVLCERGARTGQVWLLASLIEGAELYIAKVVDGHGTLEADVVSEAIDYCSEVWAVDILILPLGFPRKMPQLEQALWRAMAKDRIIFAAASNRGGNAGVTWPARQRSVIAINATHGLGNPAPYNPSPRDLDPNFSTLGELVPIQTELGTSRVSGTSIAAVIAAVIGINMLVYIKNALEKKELKGLEDWMLNRLYTNHAMQDLLELMSKKRGGYRYIAPWLLWSDDSDKEGVNNQISAVLQNL